MEGHIQQMLRMMASCKEEIKDEFKANKDEQLEKMKRELETYCLELLDMKARLEEEREETRKKDEGVTQFLKKLEARIEKQDTDKRRNNIMIIGLFLETQTKAELKEIVEEFIKGELEVEVVVKDGYKVALNMCVIELEGREDKINVMKNKFKLKGTEIYINDDLTFEQRQIRKIIVERAKVERENGHRVKIAFQKLYVDDKILIWNREKEMLDEKDAWTNA